MSRVKVVRLIFLAIVVPTVSSLIISSVYAGRKKFKTFSFDNPLLPTIVKVEPNKFHLTLRQNKYLRTPQFKIEGTLPLKAPTIIKELASQYQAYTEPEVTNINIGDIGAIPEANQHVAYDDSNPQPTYASAPGFSIGAHWKPDESPAEIGRVLPKSQYSSHHRNRRESDDYPIHRYDPNHGHYHTDHRSPPQYPYMQSSDVSYMQPNNPHNYYNPSADQFPSNNYPTHSYHLSHHSMEPMTYPTVSHQSFNGMSQMYPSVPDMTASPSSFGPPKFSNFANPTSSGKWIPIVNNPMPISSGPISAVAEPQPQASHYNQKKLAIGEHYNPSASYVDEKMVEKPTYDPDESEPDEGSVSFSISGPHGGEEVPAGYESKIKEMHEELKDHPQHLPPGLDASQLAKYYSHLTFTDPLKSSYGYKAAFGPLGFLKSKLKSWKNILS